VRAFRAFACLWLALASAVSARADDSLSRAHRFTLAWLALTPDQPLIADSPSRLCWTPHNAGADVYPFLVLTAWYTDRSLLQPLTEMLDAERRLACRPDGLPDIWDFRSRRFRPERADLRREIFGASEYCKDGLLAITELLGDGPWLTRMEELIARIFALAPVPSAYGPLPDDGAEVCGDLLQVLSRLYGATGKHEYLEWSERLGDAWLLEVLPNNGALPCQSWDFTAHKPRQDTLNLNDHGNEIIPGLLELYAITTKADPDRARGYEPAVRRMLDRLLTVARREDGLWVNRITPSTGQVLDAQVPDTWGYALDAVYTFYQLTGEEKYRAAVLQAMRGAARHRSWRGADSYADAIESGLTLLNREPCPELAARVDEWVRVMSGRQQEGGLIEGWHGDGNVARSWLLSARQKMCGVIAQPWREGLNYRAEPTGDGLLVRITSGGRSWSGRVCFDTPRSRDFWHLPVNSPRVNESPEWFVADPERWYEVRVNEGLPREMSGRQLAEGVPVRVAWGTEGSVRVTPQ